MTEILIVYYSCHGATAAMARQIARGVDEVEGCQATIRTVASLDDGQNDAEESGPPIVTLADLERCQGLVMGSPTRFGNMASAMKHFVDSTIGAWLSGALEGKPGGVFTSTGSLHGGQESTLLSMMSPLIHHGMLMVGLPYSNPDLMTTATGGTPYGPSHVAGPNSDRPLSQEEKRLCRALGSRVADIARRLG